MVSHGKFVAFYPGEHPQQGESAWGVEAQRRAAEPI